MSVQMEEITTEKVEKAQADAAAAQEELKAAITAGRSSSAGPAEVVRLGALSERAARAAVRAEQLASVAAEQEQRLVARRAAEKAAGPALDRLAGELAGSRAELASAVDAARVAVVAALDAARAHDDLVAACRVELVGLGLGGVGDGVDNETAAPGRAGLCVRGVWHGPVPTDGVLHRIVLDVAGAVLPRTDVIARLGRYSLSLSALARSGALADCVPLTPGSEPVPVPAVPADWPAPVSAVPVKRKRQGG